MLLIISFGLTKAKNIKKLYLQNNLIGIFYTFNKRPTGLCLYSMHYKIYQNIIISIDR